MSTNIINDHEGVCPRCNTKSCEDDNEHDNRIFWVSNTDGTEVCRACIRKEDEDEEEEEMCEVCHKTCKTDDTDDLVLITEINGVKHCDECLHAFLAKRAAK